MIRLSSVMTSGSRTPFAAFLQSVAAKGVLEPLVITDDNRIISGHRRWRAAQELGLSIVPVSVFPSHDELDVLEALIEANRQRTKSNEAIAREAATLLRIERERAKQRQAATARANQPQAKKSQKREPVPTSD